MTCKRCQHTAKKVRALRQAQYPAVRRMNWVFVVKVERTSRKTDQGRRMAEVIRR